MILNRAAAWVLKGIARGCTRLAAEIQGATPAPTEPDDDLGEEEPFEGTMTPEAARLRVVHPPRPRPVEAPPEPLKGSVQARLARERGRW